MHEAKRHAGRLRGEGDVFLPRIANPYKDGMRKHQSLDVLPEAILDAVFGIAYAVDCDGVILGFSRGPFLPEERDVRPVPWDADIAIGTNIFAHIQGDDVRDCFRKLHDAVWNGRSTAVGFEYRCDAPEIERKMHMSLSLIRSGEAPYAVLYQSIVVSESPRVPLPLFAADLLTGRREPRPGVQIVRLCSYCQKVALPEEPAGGQPEWMEAAEYYRRGGGSQVSVSHSVCRNCFERVVAPVLRSKSPTSAETERTATTQPTGNFSGARLELGS